MKSKKEKIYEVVKLINYYFYEVPLEKAFQNLIESNILSEEGYIIDNNISNSDNNVYYYDDISLLFHAVLKEEGLETSMVIQDSNTKKYLMHIPLDVYLYNFLIESNIKIANQRQFDLFCNVREEFAELILKYKDSISIDEFLYKNHKYVNRDMYAENSGNMKISNLKWEELPTILQMTKKEQKFANKQFKKISEYVAGGDMQPAIVVKTSPLIISAYSDEMDAVVMLKFPSEFAKRYHLEEKMRLLTCNVYWPKDIFGVASDIIVGKNYLKRYRDVIPVLSLFFVDNERLYFKKVKKIKEEAWARTEELTIEYLKVKPNVVRNGFFYLYK